MFAGTPSCGGRAAGVLLASGLLCLLLPGLSAQDQGPRAAGKSTQARIQKRTYDFKEAGKEMEYALFVPSGYVKERKTPLMVALHGLGSTPQQILRYRGLTDLAEKHGYIVVAPMGYNPRGWYGSRGPKTAKTAKTEPENLGELSEKDVMNVLALVRKEFTIDPDRIYLMGHSMGGGGTWHLGLKYPDLWAGLAPIAPAIFRKAEDVAAIKHIPVILIQGDQDKLVPPAGARRWAAEMKKLGMTYEYIEQAGGGHVDIAFTNMPKVFEFFNKHSRAQTPKTIPAAPKGFDVRRDGIPRGKIETVAYDSKSVGAKRKMVIYTPPGFSKDARYPVFYLLHGAGDDETGWQKKGSADIILDNLHADRKVVPMIVVMPNGFARAPGGKGKTDGFEKDLLEDVIPHVEAHYPVKADREQRALAGLSMGGGQALRIGLKHLDRFAWVGGFSSALFRKGPGLLPDGAEVSKKLRLLWLSCGDKDSLLKGSEAFHKELESRKVPHVWHIDSGGHTWTVWRNDLYLLAQRLFRDGK